MSFTLRRPHRAVLLGTFAAMAGYTMAYAEPAPPYATLLVEAQSRAPRLAAANASVEQAKGQALQARAYPNPTTSASVENFSGNQAFRGFNQAETTLSVSQPIELWGKRQARIRAGEAGVGAAQARLSQSVADYAFDLAIAYSQADAATRRTKLAAEILKLSQEDLRVAQTLVEAGREAQLRVLQAQSSVSAASSALQIAQAEEIDAFAKLSALAGAQTMFTSLTEPLLGRMPSSTPPISPDELAGIPAVIAAEAERAAVAERLQYERTRWQPDVTASLGARRFSADGSTALVASVSIPIPIWDQNTGNTNAAMGELRAADARLAAARYDAQAALRTASFQIGAAEARVTSATEAESAAIEAYRLSRAGYEAGRLTLVELLNAQRAIAAARNALIEAQFARVRAEAELARLQGRATFGG